MSNAIEIQNLGKKYLLRHEQSARYSALRDVIASSAHKMIKAIRHPLGGYDEGDPSVEEFWALENITINIKEGERLGIIGRNGAGKSTLLKILSRITEPTKGSVRLRGRVASLLEVGTGFHPELTGRENIFLNGAILGMGKREIARKFDAIVQFAEVERFLDTPVKRYSSGMYVRLAFSVAAHLESDILIVDEVLAVGDAAFQKKCMSKMESVTKEGRTILFVSHNMGAISELCTSAALLHKGGLIKTGAVADVLAEYNKYTLANNLTTLKLEPYEYDLTSVSSISVLNSQGNACAIFDIAEEICIEIVYKIKEPQFGLQLALTLSRNMTDILHTCDTDDYSDLPLRGAGMHKTSLRIPGMKLKAGEYGISLTLGTPEKLMQSLQHAITFSIEEFSVNTLAKGFKNERPGVIISPGYWHYEQIS